ncbi:MAG TPA: hypothetical protein VID30_05720 [Bradyrhizobium sp.]
MAIVVVMAIVIVQRRLREAASECPVRRRFGPLGPALLGEYRISNDRRTPLLETALLGAALIAARTNPADRFVAGGRRPWPLGGIAAGKRFRAL